MNKVGIIGCGNWGSTVAKIIGENVVNFQDFDPIVKLWVLEEIYDGIKLSEIINTQHENKKYLPGIKLPTNVIGVPDLVEVAKTATHFIFVVPHQFLSSTCDKMASVIQKNSVGISLIKGLFDDESKLILPSDIIRQKLHIHMSVLSGANIANEIAAEKFSTTTIGCDNLDLQQIWKKLFSAPYFRVDFISFTTPMEIFGALKNCIALGIGFCEALGFGMNAKATAIRIGYTEIIRFVSIFQPDCSRDTFLQSFGFDDLIATCFGGRNVRAAEVFIRTKKSLDEIERDLLNGQKLQGPGTILTVHNILKSKKLEQTFPLFEFIFKVIYQNESASSINKVLSS